MSIPQEGSRQLPHEVTTAEDFYRRLSSEERQVISGVIKQVDKLTDDEREGLVSDAFFGLYAIGGNVTKPDRRPDIDLMFVSNCYWSGGTFAYLGYDIEVDRTQADEEKEQSELPDPFQLECDPVIGAVNEALTGKYKVKLLTDLPDEYNYETLGTKGLLKYSPIGEFQGRPIDFIYVREFDMADIRAFEQFDNDDMGQPLPRVLLWHKTVSATQIQLHW